MTSDPNYTLMRLLRAQKHLNLALTAIESGQWKAAQVSLKDTKNVLELVSARVNLAKEEEEENPDGN